MMLISIPIFQSKTLCQRIIIVLNMQVISNKRSTRRQFVSFLKIMYKITYYSLLKTSPDARLHICTEFSKFIFPIRYVVFNDFQFKQYPWIRYAINWWSLYQILLLPVPIKSLRHSTHRYPLIHWFIVQAVAILIWTSMKPINDEYNLFHFHSTSFLSTVWLKAS